MKSTSKLLLFLIFGLFLLFIIWFGFTSLRFLETPIVSKDSSPVTFLFAQGTSVKKVAYSLQGQKVLKSPLSFLLYVRLSGAQYKLQAGEYSIDPGMTPRQLVAKLVKGDVVHHTFTLIEGWTFNQVVTALNDNRHLTHTIKDLSPAEIMEKIGHHGELPEGRFAPDTYLFGSYVLDIDILTKAYQMMEEQLQEAWNTRDKKLPYHCSYEALIVASLIEKETAVANERPMIAGVILKRLEKGMLLQIDPTVIYGLGDKYRGKLTKADLLKNTPYNTYLYKGLPPTPIAMPGKDSIDAALHPATINAFYYVAKGDGSHKFSKSLNEQNRAIKKYLFHGKSKH